ncbi:MAG: efflux RND transporter permease subunit [Phycisphaerae bacterium]|nr:efflux RND transporter permease subunit [Phycisphaerae bacterium]MDW8261113.1 efflux RND transporter permease subunit [Phycisphaerales bacterium]
MEPVIDLFVRRPVFASMIILAMVVIGAAAYTGLGVDRLPSVDLPTVNVRTTLPGASPEEVESEVSETIEEVVNTVDGIEELRSISSNGTSLVLATFRLDRDIDTAAQDVRDKVATAARRLPEETEAPIVSKFDNDSAPVITFALSGDLSLRELTELADKTVKPLLERSKSVGEVRINGGALRTINIDVDADRLAAYRLPITAVRDAIVRQNTEVPGGNLTGKGTEQSLRTLGRINSAAEFAQVVITQVNGSPVRVGDVAKVTDGTAERRSLSRLNGVPSVAVEVLRQSGANTIEVIEAVKENARRLQDLLPPGVKFEVIRDQSRYIYNALHEINTHLVFGSILASLVVLAFTRSWRSTFVAALAIPTSVISTFAVMWLLDFTLNSVTMLALVLMVGIVIDDAIVVLENIFRFVEEKGLSPMEAARHGTAEIATAVIATTLSLAIIFVPVSFMSSISGRFLYQFGITAAVAVMVSMVVSFVLTPTLSARLLGRGNRAALHKPHKGSREGFYRHIDRSYTWLLRHTMRLRWLAALLALAIIASAWPLFRMVPQGYLPQGADEAEFELRVTGPESASFQSMDLVMQQIEADLLAMPEIRTVLASVGGGFIGGVNQGECYIRIAPHEERVFTFRRLFQGLLRGDPGAAWRGNYTQTDVMQKVRAVMRKYQSRDLLISVRNFPSFNLGGGNFDIDFSISGPDLEELARYSRELADRATRIGGIINVDTTLKISKPEIHVRIDRERAFDLGVSSQEIGTALRLMVGGDLEVSRFRDPATNENYDVRLRLAEEFRDEEQKIPQLLLAGQDRVVELRNLARLEQRMSAARIDRTDRGRDARVRGTIAPGYALADRTAALLREAQAMGMPPAYSVTVRGAGREFARTYREFVFALILSVVFMYMILASQYEHLIHPITILLSLPVAIPFAFLSLYLAGEQLNLYSALGILVLFGVVKKNAILQIDHVNQLRARGMNRDDAIIQGNRDRLRPILMTTLSLVAGMLPLWIGTGPGAEERRAVAVCVIGGQFLSLLVTLLLTPVAYSYLDDLGALIRRLRTPATGVPPLPAPTVEKAAVRS